MGIWSRVTSSVAKMIGGAKIAVGVRHALSQGTPGSWASDHRTEAQHFTGWNYVAIRAIAMQAAQADVNVYDDSRDVAGQSKTIRKGWRQRTKAYRPDTGESPPLPSDHPLVQMNKRPNPSQSGASQRYEQVVQLLLTGSAYKWKVPNTQGKTVETYVIPTAVCIPIPPSRELPRGGWRVDPSMSRLQFPLGIVDDDGYSVLRGYERAIGQIIPAEQMIVTRFAHPIWKDDGYGALAAGALTIDAAEQVDQARFASMRNGADPSLLVTPPDDWTGDQAELDAVQAKLEAKYCGPKNQKKIMIVTAKSVTPVTTAPREMDYVEAFTQFRDAIMALHGTPGIAAGITDAGSKATLYASLKQFTMLTVQPILDMIAEEDTEQLNPEFGEGLTTEITAIKINDEEQTEREIQTDLQAGAITVDEVRQIRGREAWGGAKGNAVAGTDRTVTLGSMPVRAAEDSTSVTPTRPALPVEEKPELPENIEATQTLNGAQIAAALEVMAGVTAGTIAEMVAVELLVTLGLDRALAAKMVRASKAVEPPEPATNGNGHANGFKRHSAVEKKLNGAYP